MLEKLLESSESVVRQLVPSVPSDLSARVQAVGKAVMEGNVEKALRLMKQAKFFDAIENAVAQQIPD